MLIIARLVIVLFEKRSKEKEAELNSSNISGTVKVVAESPHASTPVDQVPADSLTTHTTHADLCQLMRAEYQDLKEVTPPLSTPQPQSMLTPNRRLHKLKSIPPTRSWRSSKPGSKTCASPRVAAIWKQSSVSKQSRWSTIVSRMRPAL